MQAGQHSASCALPGLVGRKPAVLNIRSTCAFRRAAPLSILNILAHCPASSSPCFARSLSTPHAATRPPELIAAARAMEQGMLPGELQPAAGAAEAAASRLSHFRSLLVQHLLAPFQQRVLQVASCHNLGAAIGDAAKLPPADIAPSGKRPAGLTAPLQQLAAVQPAGEPSGQEGAAPPPAKRARRAAGAADGMRFFLQLQRDKSGAADAEAGPTASSSSSGGDTAEALEAAQWQGSTTAHAVELPPVHAQLLRLLREDEARVVCGAPAPGVAADAARSDFLSIAAVQQGLEHAAGGCIIAAEARNMASAEVWQHPAVCWVLMYVDVDVDVDGWV